MRRLVCIFPLILTACGTAEPPPMATLARPDAPLMQECPDLPDIPKNAGNRDVRKEYDTQSRAMYVHCRDKVSGLIRYAQIVSTPKGAP